MSNKASIMILDSDPDDHAILRELFRQLETKNKLLFFKDGTEALGYLRMTVETPFLIISEVNLPKMDGLEFRSQINSDEALRRKGVLFVFLTDNHDKKKVEEAYEKMVQGYFIKKHSPDELKATLQMLVLYWSECLHRNSWFLY